jgi:hypothetical protein
MPLIAYTWNSYKNIHDYTKNQYILKEMKKIMESK